MTDHHSPIPIPIPIPIHSTPLPPSALTAADDLVHSLKLLLPVSHQLLPPSSPPSPAPSPSPPTHHYQPSLHSQLSQHVPSRFHPLSIPLHNLATAKLAINHSLSRISRALHHFNQASAFLLNPHFNHLHFNNQNSPKLIKLFAILRESATHQASLLHSTRLAQNQLHFSDHAPGPRSTFLSPSLLIDSLPQHQRSPSSLPLIEAVARDVGLECFRDSEDPNLLMIAGKLMLIDIEIDPLEAGRVRRCRFSYSFGDDEPRRDEAVDGELCHQLADVHLAFRDNDCPRYDLVALARVRRALEGFASSLRRLKALDELVDRRRVPHDPAAEPVDYFLHLRRLIAAYHAHLASPAGASAGIPLSAPSDYQLRIAYYHSPAPDLDGNSPLTLSVAFTPSAALHLHHPIPLPCQPGPESLFTAILSPPIPISRVSAERLFKLSTGSQNSHLPTDQTQSFVRRRGVRLEDLLVENIINRPSSDHDHDEDWKVKQFAIKFKDQRRYLFSFLREEEEEEGCSMEEDLGTDGSDGLGYLLEKVQFGDLKGLIEIVKVCRRQAVLNELFGSCFNVHTYLGRTAEGTVEATVDPFEGSAPLLPVSLPVHSASKPPLTLAYLLNQPNKHEDLSVDIAINHSTYTITAQLTSPDPQARILSISIQVTTESDIITSFNVERVNNVLRMKDVDEKLEKIQRNVVGNVGRKVRSVPVLVRCVVKLVLDASNGGASGDDEDDVQMKMMEET